MRVFVNNQPMVAAFKHERLDPPEQITGSRGQQREVSDRVRCSITEGETFDIEKLIVAADAHCSTSDFFDLHVGRRVALTYALKKIEAPEEMRVVFWEAFVKTLPKPRPTVRKLKKRVHELEAELEQLRKKQDAVAEWRATTPVSDGN